MTARVHTTGVAHLWVRVSDVPEQDRYLNRNLTDDSAAQYKDNGGTSLGYPIRYLGTAKTSPRISLVPLKTPVSTDTAAGHPADHVIQGKQALVVATLTRWDEDTLRRIMRRGTQIDNRGTLAFEWMGGLEVAEGLTHTLWVDFPEGLPNTPDRLPQGYRFPEAKLLQPVDLDPIGSRAMHVTLGWVCVYGHDGHGNYRLYDHDMSGVPSVIDLE